MVEEDGMPKLGSTSTLLGIRIGVDIETDAAGNVHRPAFVPRNKNGLSCSAAIEFLPQFALPIEWGGLNKKTTVWKIEVTDLPAELIAGDDCMPGIDRHISIGPSVTMAYNDFVRAIESTRPTWTKIVKN